MAARRATELRSFRPWARCTPATSRWCTRAGELADRVVVSIFVNPSQFAPHEDLARYPRDEAGDLAKLARRLRTSSGRRRRRTCIRKDSPRASRPAGAAQGLESDFRPHFFGGVATVCGKLFGAVTPDVAVFGEKDYQQLCVVKQMVRDLNMPLEIVGVATTREPDGLALSSRNVYLSAEERAIAPTLNRVLRDLAEKAQAVMSGGAPRKVKAPRPTPLVRDPTLPPQAHQLPDLIAVCEEAAAELTAAGFSKVDYIAVRAADTLQVVSDAGARPLRVLGAAWLGNTRLIDNVPG